jgi:hypothetical protein
MITEEMAKGIFERTLSVKCKACKAPVGKLCDSKSVWVHIERIEEARGAKLQQQ